MPARRFATFGLASSASAAQARTTSLSYSRRAPRRHSRRLCWAQPHCWTSPCLRRSRAAVSSCHGEVDQGGPAWLNHALRRTSHRDLRSQKQGGLTEHRVMFSTTAAAQALSRRPPVGPCVFSFCVCTWPGWRRSRSVMSDDLLYTMYVEPRIVYRLDC